MAPINFFQPEASHLCRPAMLSRLWGTFVLLIGCALATSCSRAPQVFIPEQPTARQQYEYAVNYRESKDIALRHKEDLEEWNQARLAVRMTFAKVEELFPEDRVETPLAKLEVADMLAGLDGTFAEVSNREIRGAIALFQGLQEDYPGYDFVQSKARYDEAQCWRRLKKFEKAQEKYREVAEGYLYHENPSIRRIAGMAQVHYQKVYVK